LLAREHLLLWVLWLFSVYVFDSRVCTYVHCYSGALALVAMFSGWLASWLASLRAVGGGVSRISGPLFGSLLYDIVVFADLFLSLLDSGSVRARRREPGDDVMNAADAWGYRCFFCCTRATVTGRRLMLFHEVIDADLREVRAESQMADGSATLDALLVAMSWQHMALRQRRRRACEEF